MLRDWYAREDLDKEQGFPSKEEFTNSGYWAMASNIVIEKVWQKAKKNLEVAKAFQSMMKPNPRLSEGRSGVASHSPRFWSCFWSIDRWKPPRRSKMLLPRPPWPRRRE